jgi:hypothetical protein
MVVGAALVCACAPAAVAGHPSDLDFQANAWLEDSRTWTIGDLGFIQGATRFGSRIYLYGDRADLAPRQGVIREYDLQLRPTGRSIRLLAGGESVARHPTGLTAHPELGVFLGNTVAKKATILRLDWERALADGNLDAAIRDVIRDDVAVNGCRPEVVELAGRHYLATADFGDVRPEIRLYDPVRLVAAGRSSAPGVVRHRILAGPHSQTLAWDRSRGALVCVQNVVAGVGWVLDTLDLRSAVLDGRAGGPGVRLDRRVFLPHSELEGYLSLPGGRALFVTGNREDNVTLGRIRPMATRRSPRGTSRHAP